MSLGGCYQAFFSPRDILLDRWNLQAPPTCPYSHTVNTKLRALVGRPAYRGQLHPAGNTGLRIRKEEVN